MLLRLRVRGFKNLRDVDIQFGPLTCFVGPNGVGKSNIFDAIQFLRHLSERDVQAAAEAIRSPAHRAFSPRELFWEAGPSARMAFVADMVVPEDVTDDFGQGAKPTTTMLRYSLEFQQALEPRPRLQLVRESLEPLRKSDARSVLAFPHDRAFRDSVVKGKRFGGAFISTKDDVVLLHGDGGSRGRPAPAGPSPRTILGGTNTAHYPTVLAARREMSGWQALHLEPSALRSPDSFSGPENVDERGAHIASTLHRLGTEKPAVDGVAEATKEPSNLDEVLARAANRLSRLVGNVERLRIDEDRQREQRTIELKMRGSNRWFGPRALSDGTLRFLALVTMQMDPQSCRLLCMEEPENGIHPGHVPDIVTLLGDMAVDPELRVDSDNPPRQVVINTHSPDVIRQLDAPDIVFVDRMETPDGGAAWIRPIDAEGSWRSADDPVPLSILEQVIGGAPLSDRLVSRQLRLEFGTAR